MQDLNRSITDFVQCLKEEKIVILDSVGNWALAGVLNGSMVFKKQAFFLLARHFESCLDRLEQIPVSFSHPQKIDFLSFIDACQIIENRLDKIDLPRAKDLFLSLKKRRIALLYRLEKVNEGLNKIPPNQAAFQHLLEKAAEWKQNQEIFWRKDLSDKDVDRLREACFYPEFLPLLLEYPQLKQAFFIWSLREGLPVGPFVEFPYTQKNLVESRLSPRVGRLGGNNLQIVKQFNKETGEVIKTLVMPIEGQMVNILEEQTTVVLQGNYVLKLKQIFKIFKNKPYEIGDLEYFGQGITNWNAHRLGWWNAQTGTYELIDLSQSDWWFQMPLFEILSLEEAQQRYGGKVDGKNWIFVAKASREFLTLHYDKNHAYLEIAIPVGRRAYAIYDFGKVATHFPATNWEEVATFTITVLATIAYPDENVFFSHRQHVGYCFDVTPETALHMMENIRQDMELSRRGDVVFQIESENCGHWIQSLLEENLGNDRVPNLFRMSLLDTEPPKGWVARAFALIRKMPEYSRAKILAWIHYPFGAWKGRWVVDRKGKREWKSLNTNAYWQDGIVHLPARLHRSRENLKDNDKNNSFEQIE